VPKNSESILSVFPVTPEELYARQNGKCWLELSLEPDFEANIQAGELYCTDGIDYFHTNSCLNPTIECMRCLRNFSIQVANEGIRQNAFSNKTTISGSRKGR